MDKKERSWIGSVKSSRETIALVRDLAILLVLLLLLLYPSGITGILTRIGLALEAAGFTELNVGGAKQDLKALRERLEESRLDAELANEKLVEVERAVQEARQQATGREVTGALDEATSFLAESRDRLDSARQQFDVRMPIFTSSTGDGSGTWAIVVGADRELKAAKDEVRRANGAGFDTATIVRRTNWYRTVITYPSRTTAEAALPGVLNRLRPGAFIREMNTWCENRTPTELGYEECGN